MEIRPIRSERDYERSLARVEALLQAQPLTPEFDELEILTTLIEAYERANYPIDPPSPIEAIRFRMEQGLITRAALREALGGSAKMSEVMGKKRRLSIRMIRKLHDFDIPYEALLGDDQTSKPITPKRIKRARVSGVATRSSRPR